MKWYIFILLFFLSFSLLFSQSVNDLIFYTEVYPPYNYQENGTPTGISVDLLVEMLKLVKSNKDLNDIEVIPWARGYNDIQRKDNICLFAMTRTQKREKLFKWVGPISESNNSMIALKSKKLKISSDADMKKYQIGVINEDVAEQMLKDRGIPEGNLQGSSNPLSIIQKLEAQRIDMWCYDKITAFFLIKSNNFNTSKYEIVYTLSTDELYFAFSKNVPDKVIKELQDAYNKLVKSGKYNKILEKYSK
ncbi:MAG: ABC transporter substrate-binding protein [Spirochaetes bacterium]|nr:ABC transporter substrate-binding protein [Spirochaetota bacterium]